MNALKSLLDLVGLSKSDVFFIHSIIPLNKKKYIRINWTPSRKALSSQGKKTLNLSSKYEFRVTFAQVSEA